MSIFRLLVSIASFVIIVSGLKAISGLLAPVLLSLIIVLLVYPIMVWLQRKGMPGWLAYTVIVLGVIVIGGIFLVFFAASLNQLSSSLPTYQQLISTRIQLLEELLSRYNLKFEDVLKLSWFDPEHIVQVLLSLVGNLVGTVSNAGFSLLVFIYMLASASAFGVQLSKGLVDRPELLQRFRTAGQSISTYLLIKSWLGATTALLQVILMWIMGVDFAVLWGVLSFLFNFVPNIGFYIALIPPVLLALLELGFGKALFLGIAYTLINNFFDIAIAPRYLGKGLDLSILVTFLAVVFWAWVLGPIGAFMALPLTVMVKTLLLETFDDTKLLAALLSPGDSAPSPPEEPNDIIQPIDS